MTRVSDGAVLVTEGLTKRYESRLAVAGIDLRVERGDIFGFLGPNGAGKSTTLRMVLGLVRPSAGRILLLDEDLRISPRSALRRVGAIVEAPAFYEHLTARRNLELLAALSGGASRRRIDEVLALVDLTRRADEPVAHYSHGMRQRLGIAQALLPGPELVVLDEPTDGLDPQGIHETRLLVARLRDELGITVILSSHLLHEVERISSRVAILDGGRLLFQGDPRSLSGGKPRVRVVVDRVAAALDLLSDPRLEARTVAPDTVELAAAPSEAAAINARLCGAGLAVSAIGPYRETLEEAFLRLTSSTPSSTPA